MNSLTSILVLSMAVLLSQGVPPNVKDKKAEGEKPRVLHALRGVEDNCEYKMVSERVGSICTPSFSEE